MPERIRGVKSEDPSTSPHASEHVLRASKRVEKGPEARYEGQGAGSESGISDSRWNAVLILRIRLWTFLMTFVERRWPGGIVNRNCTDALSDHRTTTTTITGIIVRRNDSPRHFATLRLSVFPPPVNARLHPPLFIAACRFPRLVPSAKEDPDGPEVVLFWVQGSPRGALLDRKTVSKCVCSMIAVCCSWDEEGMEGRDAGDLCNGGGWAEYRMGWMCMTFLLDVREEIGKATRWAISILSKWIGWGSDGDSDGCSEEEK